jgi:hypothetical protein
VGRAGLSSIVHRQTFRTQSVIAQQRHDSASTPGFRLSTACVTSLYPNQLHVCSAASGSCFEISALENYSSTRERTTTSRSAPFPPPSPGFSKRPSSISATGGIHTRSLMSSYTGRSGVNVSQYLANLNTIPSPQEVPVEPQSCDEDFSLFTNPDFFEFNDDGVTKTVLSAPLPDFDLDASSQADGANGSEPKLDFNLNGKWLAVFVSTCISSRLAPRLALFRCCSTSNPSRPIVARQGYLQTPPNALHRTVYPTHLCPATEAGPLDTAGQDALSTGIPAVEVQ